MFKQLAGPTEERREGSERRNQEWTASGLEETKQEESSGRAWQAPLPFSWAPVFSEEWRVGHGSRRVQIGVIFNETLRWGVEETGPGFWVIILWEQAPSCAQVNGRQFAAMDNKERAGKRVRPELGSLSETHQSMSEFRTKLLYQRDLVQWTADS